MKISFRTALSAIIMSAVSFHATAQDEIVIGKKANHLIPVSIKGFTGEAESVIKFDLSVLGVEESDSPEYIVSGDNNGRVEGSLSQPGVPRAMLSRSYTGGSIRAQAHAFANDIVKELRGTSPIFQTRIAFRIKHGASTEICISDYDGHNPVVVTHDNALVATPSWVPGGRELLYTSWMNGGTRVYAQNLATGARKVVAGYYGFDGDAEVSPNGQSVALILSKGGSPNLYVCDINGGGLRQLTRTRDDDSSPCWSADGREICFVCRSGRPELQKISAEGGRAVTLHPAGVYGNLTAADWSPDGSKIAFTSGSTPRTFTVWVMPAEGGMAERMAAGEDPCWAPNSRTIVFTQRQGDKQILSLLDVPTKHVKDVRQISGSCSEPSWAR